jgi:hypothetical protein
MVASDHKLKRWRERLKPLAGLDSAGGRMVDPARAAFEPRLELILILSEIVQQAGRVTPLAGAELGRVLVREGGDPVQMVVQRLPVGAVRPVGGMGEIAALSLQSYQPFSDNA